MKLDFLILTALQAATCQAVWEDPRDTQPYPRIAYRRLPQETRLRSSPWKNLTTTAGAISAPATGAQALSGLPAATGAAAPITASANASATATATTTTTVQVVTTVLPAGTVQILPSPKGQTPCTTGTVRTSLDTEGYNTQPPILTGSIPEPSTLLAPATIITPATTQASAGAKAIMASADIFDAPVATGPPPANIPRRTDHPAPRLGVAWPAPIGTNKFYANMFLGSQTAPTFLHPYSVAWSKGGGPSSSWGLAISHIDASQRVLGPADASSGAASYFINPVGIQSVCISALELGPDTVLTTDQLTDFSARVSLRPGRQATAAVEFPLVQGAGFITAVFHGARPLIQSGVLFRSVTRAARDPKPGVSKFVLLLEDGKTWFLYAQQTPGAPPLDLRVVNNGLVQAAAPFYGIVQVAKDPGNGSIGEPLYDRAAGAYATDVELSGAATSNGTTGAASYTFRFARAGRPDAPLAMFALPHHQASFDGPTRAAVTGVRLQTTTKGVAAAVLADSWTMVEPELPVDMGFAPWLPGRGSLTRLSPPARDYIHGIARQEISQDMDQQTNQNSMYFSGKALAKFATIVVTVNDVLGDPGLARAGLDRLKAAFARFADNRQQFPLVYESAWGGVVSNASYETGNPGDDFGNTYYNDHHFHYGYFIYCAAAIAYLDPSWVAANRDYVNTLVRDVANPSSADAFFPVWRNWDWYHGHSWAHGLYEVFDGKDQESSSEDVMHAYAIKMWGRVSGDPNMEARSNLQLAILARTLPSYYLYASDNTIQPAQFIGNKVAGILFENKVDHTTYFGANIEYIQGIHMLPLLPSTPLVRPPGFVREEWDAFFSGGRADRIAGGWRGILYGSYATIDPVGAHHFFRSEPFDPAWLDGGASRTWYLAYSAALAGL